MDKKQWSIAHDIAFDLVDWGTDPNELDKVIAFVRSYQNDSEVKNRLFIPYSAVGKYSETHSSVVVRRSGIIRISKRHVRNISMTSVIRVDILTILGWSLRLMRYYRVEPKRATEEQRPPQEPKQAPKLRLPQTPQPPKAPEKPKIRVGNRVNATILKKDGFKVTVQLQTDNNEELVFERPYYPGNAGTQVKLRVQGVNENGEVTEVIP